MKVSRTSAPHYRWGGGCDGWRLLTGDDLSVIHERMPPRTSEKWHCHERARQFFFVLAGTLALETEAKCTCLFAGEGCEVPPATVHRVVNASDRVTDFLVVSSPTTAGDRQDCEPVLREGAHHVE